MMSASVLEVHGQVGMVPVAEHAQAHEAAALAVDLACGVLAAGLAEGVRVDGLADLADGLFDLQLDRQAVAIPARHVGRVEALQAAALDDDVLEDLVDRMADMDVAVGVGRAVVEDEALASGACFTQAVVDVHRLPALERVGFAFGQVAAHGEVGVRQVERVLVVGHGCVRASGCVGLRVQAWRLSMASARSASWRIWRLSASRESKRRSSRILRLSSTQRWWP